MPGLPRDDIDILVKAVKGSLQDVQFSLPGKVVKYDAVANLADIEIGTEHPIYDDDNVLAHEDLGILIGVPVATPRGGGFIVRVPLTAGDTGHLIFSSASLLEWRTTGAKSQPADGARHTLNWAIFYPGLTPDTNPPAPGDAMTAATSLIIGVDGGTPQIRISKNDIELGAGATDFVALTSLVMNALNKIQSTFDAHTHMVTVPGSGLTAPAGGGPVTGSASMVACAVPGSAIGALASVAATIAKAK